MKTVTDVRSLGRHARGGCLRLGPRAGGRSASDIGCAERDGHRSDRAGHLHRRRASLPVEPGTYFIDADLDPSTSLRVVFDIPAEGWSSWLGATKFGPDDGHVGVSITTVVNLVTDGCADHLAADPPIGPSVDDLATALSELEPFEVTTPPQDVTIYGYSGKHLEWTVPDMAFDRCDAGDVRSWIAPIDTAEPGDAYYGYTGPGYREEFWILDVEGTRLMIAAERSPGSPSGDLAELRDILDSIRLEP